MKINSENISYKISNNLLEEVSKKYDSYPKSPLRFPGGKTRAVKQILSLIPSNINRLISPFFGGGSIEIAIAHFGIDVFGFDNFKPLVDFWQELLSNPIQLAKDVEAFHPLERDLFYQLQRNHPTDRKKSAIVFFVLNRTSYSGSTLSGGMTPGNPRFNNAAIEYLKNFKCRNLSVDLADYSEVLRKFSNDFFYLDPPYLISSNLYGKNGNMHRDFDHHLLFEQLKNKDKWILSYNNCNEICELYKDFRILQPHWKYGMSNNKNSREILILSDQIPNVEKINQNI